ncbi:MAG: CDC/Septin GTPase family protein [Amphiamblys sp. WSBS2006]|nr:MAG: CDC/Septin GTPase family protein [Amphiamblys sp. WSBS2006]OIR59027.1 MAG: CDC/Septin GTPase family protein [Amphiamblys sp. WSBS2006]
MVRTTHIPQNETIGYSNIPNQIMTASRKHIFRLNILIAGEYSRKEISVLNALFGQDVLSANRQEAEKGGVKFVTSGAMIEEHGVLFLVSITQTAGGESQQESISGFIEGQFLKHGETESPLKPEDDQSKDERPHVCLFFIKPHARKLGKKSMDFLKKTSARLPLVPIISCAETLTSFEVARKRREIHRQLQENNLACLSFENISWLESSRRPAIEPFWVLFPLAVPSGLLAQKECSEYGPRRRKYPWGVMNAEEVHDEDFLVLRRILASHYFAFLKKEADFIYRQSKHEKTAPAECKSERAIEERVEKKIFEYGEFCTMAKSISLEETIGTSLELK